MKVLKLLKLKNGNKDFPSVKIKSVEKMRTAKTAPMIPQSKPQDIVLLQYTSGSTSDPKVVITTY